MADDEMRRRLDDTKKGTAILAACIVQALNETDPSFRERFLQHLEQSAMDAEDAVGVDCLELFTWTREVLTAPDLYSLLGPLRR